MHRRHDHPQGDPALEPERSFSEPPAPYSAAELRAVVLRPQRIVGLVLTERGRLAASVVQRRHLALLAAVLLLASVLLSLPLGAALDPASFWRVAWLLVGSLLICFPSLHVFGAYLGSRASLTQSLCLALTLTCVAGLFCLAFAPILWFLDVTMTRSGQIGAAEVAVVLLGAALLLGIVHLTRLLFAERALRGLGTSSWLILLWQLLLVLISYRMAGFLGLL